MPKEFISIQEAAELSRKSAQTLRRAIKAKRLKFKKSRTPQGFNYLINQKSLCELYKIKLPSAENDRASGRASTKAKIKFSKDPQTMTIDTDDFKAFARTIENMMNKHSDERQNFLRLVDTLQERIFVLENQLNLLKAAPIEKKWYHFWK